MDVDYIVRSSHFSSEAGPALAVRIQVRRLMQPLFAAGRIVHETIANNGLTAALLL